MLPFQNFPTFCNVGTALKPYAVVGAPTDAATSFRSGARMGPNAIRAISLMITDGQHELFPIDLTQTVCDVGNISLTSGNTIRMLQEVEMAMDRLKGMHCVTLGGDHLITLGILRSIAKRHRDLAVLHFDAHCDTWDNHFGEPFGHGTWLYNAVCEKLIDPTHTISIGIRSPADQNSREFLSKCGGRTFSAQRAMKWSPLAMHEIIKSTVGDRAVYLSLDIDCLDPAFAPGTGTPEIAGLTTVWMRELLDLCKDINFVGMDCVEVSPPYDHSDITSLAAATFCWQYLSMVSYNNV
jgi:agmatinase